MCLVIIAYRTIVNYPVVVAANRDEAYDRGGEPPMVLNRSPVVWGGRDPVAGGTWLGVNEQGLLVALTDRPAASPDRSLRSRGLLCLDALRLPSAAAVGDWLARELVSRAYNPFNLFYADSASAAVSYYDGSLRSEDVRPGVHVLTDGSLDDRDQPKIARAFELLADLPRTCPEALERLWNVCGDRREGTAEREQICILGARSGTLSSSIIALSDRFPAQSFYYHAEAAPCQADYEDFSALFRVRVVRER